MKYLIITNHSYMLWQFRRELIAELIKDGEVVISTPFAGHEDDFADMGCRMIETQLDRRSIDPMEEARLVRFYIRLLSGRTSRSPTRSSPTSTQALPAGCSGSRTA